ncbi:MAG: FixH family protein [Bacteroidota bacterium]|nr:FixH family protein [Bacteroidota bacterium]MDP4232425.1 FixH family protein [Bacteroidota bacterium]MDP4241561.1 FixH family protein [Bacteroidota bacterium]MDP4286305.1 FixH family protein [Bacteroidota bacterium]
MIRIKQISWGWGIIAAYVIFIAGTASWVGYAMTTEVDLVRGDYYEQSLKQDVTVAAQARAATLSGAASIQNDRSRGVFAIQIPRDQAASAQGSVTLYRPNASNEDRTLKLALGSNGSMLVPTAQLSRGLWRVTLDWTFQNQSYQLIADDTL